MVTLPHCCSSSDSPKRRSISSMQSYVSCTISIDAGLVRARVNRQAARDEACDAISLASNNNTFPALRLANW